MKIRADRRIGLLLAGVVLATFVALGATVALPASDPALKKSKADAAWTQIVDAVSEKSADMVTSADFASLAPALYALDRLGLDDAGDVTPAAPAEVYQPLSADDVAALTAYLFALHR